MVQLFGIIFIAISIREMKEGPKRRRRVVGVRKWADAVESEGVNKLSATAEEEKGATGAGQTAILICIFLNQQHAIAAAEAASS